MPSTIGWLAVAVAAGSLAGLFVGHWSTVAGWLHRCVEDPVGRRHADGTTALGERTRRTS